jgi:hypothetical protein
MVTGGWVQKTLVEKISGTWHPSKELDGDIQIAKQ